MLIILKQSQKDEHLNARLRDCQILAFVRYRWECLQDPGILLRNVGVSPLSGFYYAKNVRPLAKGPFFPPLTGRKAIRAIV